MFKLFSKKAPVVDNQVYAPANGEIINLEAVSDKVFASKAMGEGFGTKPSDNQIVAPFSGTIMMVASTKHAVGIKTVSGLEILIHMGVDTVDLKGTPFEIFVKVGDEVKGGQPIAEMALDQVEAAGLDTVVMTVVTNTNDKLEALQVNPGQVTRGDVVGNVTTK
ncbi:PTS glucose transporter subunit IIA [Agrilactobacillus yilanensis]|uniref:PTS glucose transporter subunit IIA n=1 Tax=Agrilactobacillus yilanensis TaxID=2485997 RepID=A0ABW4J7Q8_9LACO|nr:PTS glucose transporter subunit IIA [Agrilactobacillus yilanensis]